MVHSKITIDITTMSSTNENARLFMVGKVKNIRLRLTRIVCKSKLFDFLRKI